MVGLIHRAIFVLACAAALVGTASAQTPNVTVVPVNVTPIGMDASGQLLTSHQYRASAATAANQPLYYARTIRIGKSALAIALKARRFLGPALVLDALLEGAGWGINEITAQITNGSGVPGTPNPAGVSGWTESVYGGTHSTYTTALNVSMANLCNSSPPCSVNTRTWGLRPAWPGVYQYTISMKNSLGVACCASFTIRASPQTATGATDPAMVADVLPAEVTDEEVHQLVKDNPAALKEILTYPAYPKNITGAEPQANFANKPMVVEPMPATMAAVATQYRADQGLAAGTNTSPAALPAPTSSPYTATVPNPAAEEEPATANAAASASVEFPVFCSWASKICDFVDWVKEPEATTADEPVPEKQIQAETWSSGLGGGSCPAPYSVFVSGVQQFATYKPYCDIAEGIKPFLLIAASLAAAFILARR